MTAKYMIKDGALVQVDGELMPSRMGEIVLARKAPGIATRERHRQHDAWSHRGLWGTVRDGECGALAETRQRLEAGAFPRGRSRTLALADVRTYELARQNGLPTDGIAERLRGHCRAADDARTPTTKRTRAGFRKETISRRRNRRGGIDLTTRIS